MPPSESRGISDFSGNQQLHDFERTEPSPPPPHMSQSTECPLVFKSPIDGGFPVRSNPTACHSSAHVPPQVLHRSQNSPVSPPLFDTARAAYFLLSSLRLHLSLWLPPSWRRSPHRALSDASSGFPLSQGAQTTGSRRTDGQTEAGIASGLSNSASPTRAIAPLISVSPSLMHSRGPSRPLPLSFSPVRSLLPVCVSSRCRCSAFTRSFSLTHLASLLFFSFSSH